MPRQVRSWQSLNGLCRPTKALTTIGERGEDGGPGLLYAVRAWVRQHPEWTVVRHDRNNHGLMILSRDQRDKPKVKDNLLTLAGRWLAARAQHLWSGKGYLPKEESEARLEACSLCPFRAGDRCVECGCFLDRAPDGSPGRAHYPHLDCPVGKWPLPMEGK